jgi:hypothetical protein
VVLKINDYFSVVILISSKLVGNNINCGITVAGNTSLL